MSRYVSLSGCGTWPCNSAVRVLRCQRRSRRFKSGQGRLTHRTRCARIETHNAQLLCWLGVTRLSIWVGRGFDSRLRDVVPQYFDSRYRIEYTSATGQPSPTVQADDRPRCRAYGSVRQWLDFLLYTEADGGSNPSRSTFRKVTPRARTESDALQENILGSIL